MPDPAVERAIASALAAALGHGAMLTRNWTSVGGGCISEAARFETDVGPFFAKWNRNPPRDLFESEALGLLEMAAGPSSLKTPKVVVVSGTGMEPAFIVMECLETGPLPSADDEEALGRGLAEMHRRVAPRFGFPRDTYCGATRQANAWWRGLRSAGASDREEVRVEDPGE